MDETWPLAPYPLAQTTRGVPQGATCAFEQLVRLASTSSTVKHSSRLQSLEPRLHVDGVYREGAKMADRMRDASGKEIDVTVAGLPRTAVRDLMQ